MMGVVVDYGASLGTRLLKPELESALGPHEGGDGIACGIDLDVACKVTGGKCGDGILDVDFDRDAERYVTHGFRRRHDVKRYLTVATANVFSMKIALVTRIGVNLHSFGHSASASGPREPQACRPALSAR